LEHSRRWHGYCRALREAGIAGPPRSGGNELFDPSTGALDALLGGPDATTGLVFWTDFVATLLWPHLVARGVRVPEDLSLIGYDNTPLPALPPLDSVDQSLDRQVEYAARLLEPTAGGATPPPAAPMHVLAPYVVARGSCAAPSRRAR
jgi:LacI family transcriptional regulator